MLEKIQKTIRSVGAWQAEEFLKRKNKLIKSDGSFVSNVDKESEKTIAAALKKAFPGCSIIGEEGIREYGESGIQIVVDPLDGTSNYLSGIAYWAIGVALCKEGVLSEALIYLPYFHKTYYSDGKVIRVNGRVIKKRKNTSKLAGVSSRYNVANLKAGSGYRIRQIGCSLCSMLFVSQGNFGAFLSEKSGYVWDMLAGKLFVEASGGVVVGENGSEINVPSLIASPDRKLTYYAFSSLKAQKELLGHEKD